VKTIHGSADTPIGAVLDASGQEDAAFVRDGEAVALIVPHDEDDLEWYARESDPEFIASARGGNGVDA
jgi:hypothetical protein